jgi:hypothetical protein
MHLKFLTLNLELQLQTRKAKLQTPNTKLRTPNSEFFTLNPIRFTHSTINSKSLNFCTLHPKPYPLNLKPLNPKSHQESLLLAETRACAAELRLNVAKKTLGTQAGQGTSGWSVSNIMSRVQCSGFRV